MPIDLECPCGKRVGVPEHYAGKTIRCPACKKPLGVPAPEPGPPTPDLPATVLPELVFKQAPVGMPPEPWYYGFLSGLAVFILSAGILVCLLVMMVGFGHATSPDVEGSGAREAFGTYLMVTGGVSIIGVLFTAATALLGVDVARNIRATRYGVK